MEEQVVEMELDTGQQRATVFERREGDGREQEDLAVRIRGGAQHGLAAISSTCCRSAVLSLPACWPLNDYGFKTLSGQ